MPDPIHWERLLLHLLTELETYEHPYSAERQAVHLYTTIFRRWNGDVDASEET